MKLYQVLLSLAFVWALGGLTPVMAQTTGSGHFVLVAQGNLSATSTATDTASGKGVMYLIGNGYTGSSTSAFLALKCTSGCSFGNLAVGYFAYSDAGYTSQVGACVYDAVGNSGAFDGFIQLSNKTTETGVGCNFLPQYYYNVQLSLHDALTFGTHLKYYYGSTVNSHDWVTCIPTSPSSCTATETFFPYFSIVGSNFQINPAASSTGIFFSGAVDLCNNLFASSTGIGGYIGNGVCIAGGFLFVPSESAISSFQNIPATLGRTPPISWFGEIKDILDTAEASSTENWINLSINFGTTTQKLGFTNLNVISTTTLSKYMDTNTRLLIKNLISVSFYLLAAGLIYSQIYGIWKSA